MLNTLGMIAEASAEAAAESSNNTFLGLVSIDPGTIVFTLINTLIIFLIFRIFLYKPVCKMLDKRKALAAAEIDEAKKAKEAAQKAEEEYTARLADAKSEASEIVKQATQRAQKREEEIVGEANKKAAEIRSKAEENIERDKQRALNEIKDEISEIVVMAAGKVAQKEISASDNEEIISKFLEEVGTAR